MNEPVWPYGTGGRCGAQFAETQRWMLNDIAKLGVEGALDHWLATGRIGAAVRGVIQASDIAAMERAMGVPL